jgi:hypothetical protein
MVQIARGGDRFLEMMESECRFRVHDRLIMRALPCNQI